jgi:hypothetical protein
LKTGGGRLTIWSAFLKGLVKRGLKVSLR